jgi:GNAT superfamily N-acetyltransferase
MADAVVALGRATPAELTQIEVFYQTCGYTGGVTSDDIIFVARGGGAIAGCVRLCREAGSLVLRGMHVAPAWQRQRVGTQLLHEIVGAIGTDPCYCLPWAHLEAFYGADGLVRTAQHEAPAFLQVRLAEYLARGLDVILMRRG